MKNIIMYCEIEHLTKEEQAELIADLFASISHEYDPLHTQDIEIPPFKKSDMVIISVKTVETQLSQIKTNK